MKTLRIFISSPGDVQEERGKAKQVISTLQREVGGDVTLLPVLWEDLAIPATASFQEGIDFVLSEKHRIDIAVFILWSRLGTPLGACITKPDGSAYRSGTEREFDLMLRAFERSGRKTPLILAYTRRDEAAFSEKLDTTKHSGDAIRDFLEQRELVSHFINENFKDNEGRNLRAYHSYPEPVAFAQRLHVHLRQAVHDLLGLDHPAALWTDSPYRSLEVFDIQHAPIFCGRDEETCDVLQRLRDQQTAGCAFVCIVGASGSGKSSLARAGVAATLLQRSFDDGIKAWRAAVFIPGHAQGDLFNALARVLASALPELRDGIGGLEKLAQCFESQNHEAAGILIDTALSRPHKEPGTKNQELRVLLLLDQLEELWTDRSITPEQREKFLQTIESLARSGSISVLATLRSDFYPQAQLSPAFLRMKAERGHFDLTPPGPAALHQLIVQPARRAGLHFERHPQTGRTLDQQILEDAARDPSALPLLQYALAELYEKWSAQSPEQRATRTLAFADYEAMGGVEGALAKRAAQTFDSLPSYVRAALDELLPLLISVDIAGEQNAVRRRAPLTDLTSTPARRSLTEALVKARFLTADDGQSDTPIATLSHEALLRRWDRVRDWINTNRDLLRMRARVEQYHAMWEESGRNKSRLLPSGLPLEEAKGLVTTHQRLATAAVTSFVNASSHRASKRRRRAFAILGSLTLLAVIAAVWALRQSGALSVALKAQRHTLGDADHGIATHLLREKDEPKALAKLASALTWEPGHQKAAVLTAFMLEQYPAKEQLLPMEIHRLPETEAGTLEVDETHRWALSHDGARLIVRDAATWQEKGRSEPLGRIAWAHWQKGKIGAFAEDGTFHVVSLGGDGSLATVEHHRIGPGVRRVIWTPLGKPALAVLRDAEDKANAIGNERAEGELLRFFGGDANHRAEVRGAGKVGEAYVTPDGKRALVMVRDGADGHDVLHVYAADAAKPLWSIECEKAEPLTVVMRADGQALLRLGAFLRRLDVLSLREWSLKLDSVFEDETRLSPDGQWAVVYGGSGFDLLFFPLQKVDDSELKPGPLGGLIATKLPSLHSCVFTNDSKVLVVSRADEVPGEAMDFYTLDVSDALMGDLITPTEQWKLYNKRFLSALGSNGFIIWDEKKEKIDRAYLIDNEDDSEEWTSLSPHFDAYGEGHALTHIGDGWGMTVSEGSKVLVWQAGQDQSQALRESEPVTTVWGSKERWLTATANHIALWPLEQSTLSHEQVLGFDPYDRDHMRFNPAKRAVRQLPDGRWLWTTVYTTDEGDWGLADAGRELATFATPIMREDLPTQGTCTDDGSVLFVANTKSEVQAWDTTPSKTPARFVPPPDAGARLIALEQSSPRALYLGSNGRCVEVDLAGKLPPTVLSALPSATFASRGAAITLPAAQGWLVGAMDAAHQWQVFQVDAQHEDALALSSPHPTTKHLAPLLMTFAVSPSGRYWAAIAQERNNLTNRWVWCRDTQSGKVLFDGRPEVEFNLDDRRLFAGLRFDKDERFLGSDGCESGTDTDDTNAFAFDLGTEDGRAEFPALNSLLSLATQATGQPTPSWLPKFLYRLADEGDQAAPGNKSLLTRQEMAQQLGVAAGEPSVFGRLVSRWIGPLPTQSGTSPSPHTSDAFDAVRAAWQQFDELEGKDDQKPQTGAALRTVLELYRALSARAPLGSYHAARFGEALLRTGDYASAIPVLSQAEKAFPFHCTHETSVKLGKELRVHHAYALWLAGRKDDAMRYAVEQDFYGWHWTSSHGTLRIYHVDRVEDIDCDAALRQATPKPAQSAKAQQPAIVTASSNGKRTAADIARDRAWAAIESSTRSNDPTVRRRFLEEAATRLAESINAPQVSEATRQQVTGGGYGYESAELEPDSIHNWVNDMVYLARVQQALGRDDEAKANLARADGYYSQVLPVVQAKLRQAQGRKDEAMALWWRLTQGYKLSWRHAAEAAFSARQWGELLRAAEFLQMPISGDWRFADTLVGWLQWERGHEWEALKAWTEAENSSEPLKADEENPVPHGFTRGHWLPGIAAVLSETQPAAALACWRVTLRERPELALPGALDAGFMEPLWSWQNSKLAPPRPLQRLDELRKRLKKLHALVPEDERLAAQASGLLAEKHKDEAVRLLATAVSRFPSSPWLALQQAAIATQDRDDDRALDAWRVALAGLAGEKESLKEAMLGTDLRLEGLPPIKAVLELAGRTQGGAIGAKLAALLPAARGLLDEHHYAPPLDGWLLLAALDADTERQSIRFFEEQITQFDEKHPRYVILDSDIELQKQLHAGYALACALHAEEKPSPLETCARWFDLLGAPGDENLSKWSTRLTQWQAPAQVFKRLKPLFAAASKQPVEEARWAVREPDKLVEWLRCLGHEEAALAEEMRREEDIDRRAALLLKHGKPEDFDEVIRLLRPVMDEQTYGLDSGAGRRLAIARALIGKGEREAALKLLVELFESPTLRPRLHMDAKPDEALALLVETASALGRPQQALDIIANVARLVPENEAIAQRAGWCALAQDHDEEALEFFARCHSSKESDEVRRIGTAIAQWRLGRRKEALAAYFDNVRENLSHASASYRPPGFPEGFAPDLAVVRAAMTEADFEALFKTQHLDTSGEFVRKSDTLWFLGLKPAAVTAAREALAKTDVKDAKARSQAAWALADYLRKLPNPTAEELREAEQLAADAVRLNPDHHEMRAIWLSLLCKVKRLDLVPENFHRTLAFEAITAAAAVELFDTASSAGGLALADKLYEAEPANRQAELRASWIGLQVRFGAYQRALNLAAEHRDKLDAEYFAKLNAFALAGLGQLDAAVTSYIDQLSLDSIEATTKIEDSVDSWQLMRRQLREALAKLPAEALLTHAQRLRALAPARLEAFAKSLDELKLWPQAFGVHEALLLQSTDNLSGTALSLLLATRSLDSRPSDVTRSLSYLSQPAWTLPAGAAAFELNDEVAKKLVDLSLKGLTTHSQAITRRCLELREQAEPEHVSPDYLQQGYELEHLGDSAAADAAYVSALNRFGPVPAVLNDHAWVLFNRSEWDKMKATVHQVLAHHQANGYSTLDSPTLILQGALLWATHDEDAAITAYHRAAVLNPDLTTATYFSPDKPTASFWSAKERAVLEPLRDATLAKHPELVGKK